MADKSLDCRTLGPFDVIRLPFQFPGNPETVFKRFVVALNSEEQEAVVCFTSTSQSQYYDSDPERLKGVVVYAAGEVSQFPMKTFIDPDVLPIGWSYILSCHKNGEFQNLGGLPKDFRARMITAVRAKAEWRRVQKEQFLAWFERG